LQYAAQHGNTTAVEYLINCGANPRVKDKLGKTAFDIATEHSQNVVVSILQKFQ
jgi:ankyrin repeat protein